MTGPWQTRYENKLATPAQAVSYVPRGRRILIGSGAAEPTRLVEALDNHGLEVTTELERGVQHLTLRFPSAPRGTAAPPRDDPNGGP